MIACPATRRVSQGRVSMSSCLIDRVRNVEREQSDLGGYTPVACRSPGSDQAQLLRPG
jgi:hypothetical protein